MSTPVIQKKEEGICTLTTNGKSFSKLAETVGLLMKASMFVVCALPFRSNWWG